MTLTLFSTDAIRTQDRRGEKKDTKSHRGLAKTYQGRRPRD